eukprot:Em0018g612a
MQAASVKDARQMRWDPIMLSNDNIRDPLASSMLVLMVRGLFTALTFPYAQFPCTDLSGDKLFPLAWNAVSHLENLGFTVLALCCDGLSANRKFFQLHDAGSKAPVHRVVNPYAHDELYTKNRAQADYTGLALIPKLKFEHIHLTSYSKMRVDLAAQVLSNSVAKGLLLFVGDKASQTARFAEMFDRFFDCLNSSSLSADKSQRSMMLLSKETRQGLKLTVMSFVELVQYLFTIPRVTVFFLDNSDKEEEPTGIHHHLSSSATLKHCALSLIHVALYVAIVEVVSPLIVTW